jgi:hypothetical protein
MIECHLSLMLKLLTLLGGCLLSTRCISELLLLLMYL